MTYHQIKKGYYMVKNELLNASGCFSVSEGNYYVITFLWTEGFLKCHNLIPFVTKELAEKHKKELNTMNILAVVVSIHEMADDITEQHSKNNQLKSEEN
jgi:hypothetical protein